MKDGTTYPKNAALAVLLSGNPGAGKTVACFSFPDPWILDCEGNLKSGIERNPGKRFWYDTPERKADGTPVAPHEWWLRTADLIKEAGKSEAKTLVVDGLGRVALGLKDYLVYEVGKVEKLPVIAGEKQMAQSTWMVYERKLMEFVWLLRSFGKPVVVTCHLKVDTNELSSIKEQRVDIQGRLVDSFPKLFTDFYQLMATPNSDAKYAASRGVRYYIRTAPTNRVELKCSCGLPAEFELGDECWKKVIASLSAPAAP